MIECKRLNGTVLFLNPDMIQMIEATPDTVITLTTEEKLIVADSVPDLVQRFIRYKQQVLSILAPDYISPPRQGGTVISKEELGSSSASSALRKPPV